MISMMIRTARYTTMASLVLGIAACGQSDRNDPQEAASQAEEARNSTVDDTRAEPKDRPERKSIIRADIEQTPAEKPLAEPVILVVPFPENGGKPDQAGLALIDGLISSPAFQAGGPITIWGHSDSGGSDAANLAASRRRAETVSDYLKTKGAAPGRITVIPLGEDRPIAPNRKLDGSDDPEGRSRNRRVEIKIDLPPAAVLPDTPEANRPGNDPG